MKPTLPEAAPYIRAIYAQHSAGCCWHITLDDGNIEDSHIQFCIDNAADRDCKTPEACRALGPLMLGMSKTQRRKAVRWAFSHCEDCGKTLDRRNDRDHGITCQGPPGGWAKWAHEQATVDAQGEDKNG